MDIYEAALRRLKADTTPLLELERRTGIPYETIRDIRSGHSKHPRLNTVKSIIAYYSRPASRRA